MANSPVVQVVLPQYLKDFLEKEAKDKGVTVSEALRDIVKEAKRVHDGR